METNAGGAVMKNIIRIILSISPILMLSGCCCGIGGMWVNGNPFPSPQKPALYSWYKDGVSSEERRNDAVICGSVRPVITANSPCVIRDFSCEDHLDNMPIFPNITIQKERENLWKKWRNCMQSKGYTRLPNETVDKMYESRKINGKWQWVRIRSSPPNPNE
jgi:hypothetical protein